MLRTPSFQRSGWVRVTTLRIPCPVCGSKDWCTVTGDGTACNCPRTPSDEPIYGQHGDFVGYLHRLGEDRRDLVSVPRSVVGRAAAPKSPSPRLMGLIDRCRQSRPAPLEGHARALGVSAASLARLHCTFAADWFCRRCGSAADALAFPMFRSPSRATGVRLRFCQCGHKSSVSGGHEGLFIPAELSGDGPLLLPEGPTTTAACLDFGLDAIGRPSCSGGVGLLVELLQRNWGRDLRGRKRELVVVADNDPGKRRPDGTVYYPGQDGAERTATVLASQGWPVRIVQPPRAEVKDLRDWLKLGATRAVLDCVIRNASYVVAPREGRACA
jgi:hypothetical protein